MLNCITVNAQHLLQALNVVSDCAERAVKLSSDLLPSAKAEECSSTTYALLQIVAQSTKVESCWIKMLNIEVTILKFEPNLIPTLNYISVYILHIVQCTLWASTVQSDVHTGVNVCGILVIFAPDWSTDNFQMPNWIKVWLLALWLPTNWK